MKKIHIFTHIDLDGIGCCELIYWAFPKAEITFDVATVYSFREVYTKWLVENDPNDYDCIFVTDLDISGDRDLIDNKNFFVIDHHHDHSAKGNYQKAKTVILDYSSATKLAYKTFKKLYNLKLTNAQMKLVALIDDYDSYKLTVPESRELNIVFWSTPSRYKTFLKQFSAGFNGFNHTQQTMIRLYEEKLNSLRENMDVFHGKIKVQGKDRNIYACCCDHSINDVADILLQDYPSNMAIIVNHKTRHVSFRKSTTEYDEDLNLALFAEKVADGSGHEYASGGNITETFMLFLKKLEKVD